MDNLNLEILLEHGMRELFVRFPLPLALIEPGGHIEVNERYITLFGHTPPPGEQLQRLQQSPQRTWQALRMTTLSDGEIEFYAQSVPVQRGNMLVINETSETIHNSELKQLRGRIAELEKVSATDYLTGAWNRAHLVRVVASEMARSVRFRQPLSALLIDIDHFKNVNDTHGHQAGDAVLCELVSLIQRKIRSADLMFRWGGEEFVVLAVSTGYRDAETLAEHLRSRVASHKFPGIGPLTVSIGVTERNGDETADQWFKRLDTALFSAKNSGRNRVVADRCGDSDKWISDGGQTALRLTWHDSYACGQPEIDEEHRELFSLANNLITVAQKNHAGIDAALVALLLHLEQHFAHEEKILAARGYARLEEHRQAHTSLLRKAGELRDAAAAEGNASFGALIDFLANDVVARHLFTADRDYYPLFLDNKV